MKRALLIGINYTGTQNQLNGCINDIKNINNVLTKSCDYQSSNIRILTDETNIKPTRANMESNIKWLASNCVAGDILFFYYSGHGSQIKDTTNDETDGLDDVLVPLDYGTKGIISDDWLYQNLAALLPQGVTLWAFTDCCHSGTMLDLQYNLKCNSTYTKGTVNQNVKYNSVEWTNQFSFANERSKVTTANVYLISGCLDSQTSADAYLKNQSQGAFTCCFLEFIANNSTTLPNGIPKFNSGSKKIVDVIKEVNCRLTIKNFNQRPQLSMGKVQDINVPFYI
jgi:hypothetical protein